MGVQLFTLVHVALSLVGIFTGFVALFGFPGLSDTQDTLTPAGSAELAVGLSQREREKNRWMNWFLATTVLTNLTGFGFPVEHFLPSHAIAALSLLILGVALYARYAKGQAGCWGRLFLVSALAAQYFNVAVLVIQLFMRVPALHELAPHQNEWPFLVTQLVLLVAFVWLGVGAVRQR